MTISHDTRDPHRQQLDAFDHLLLARRDPVEVRRMQSFLTRLSCGPPQLLEFNIEHEADGSCCRLEPWPQTMEAVLAVVTSGDDPAARDSGRAAAKEYRS